MGNTIKIDNLLAICNDYYGKKQKKYSELDVDINTCFNFFESISDKWYMENFHSDILYTILNPNTLEIGQEKFMELFVQFLNKIKKCNFNCKSNYEVYREYPTKNIFAATNTRGIKGYIDILIKNDTQAIIIENKINNAPDQKNQLVRYMSHLVDLGIDKENITVVYLTLTSQNCGPDLSKYDGEFKVLTDYLKRNLIIINAISINNDLAKSFLGECCSYLDKNNYSKKSNLALTYINQYKIMLEHLGGEAYMDDFKKDFLNNIYSSVDMINAASELSTVWNSRYRIIEEMIKANMKNHLVFELQKVHECSNFYAWNIPRENYRVYWNRKNELGFASVEGEKFDPITQEKLYNDIEVLLADNNIKYNNGEKKDYMNEHFIIFEIKETQNYINNIETTLRLLNKIPLK